MHSWMEKSSSIPEGAPAEASRAFTCCHFELPSGIAGFVELGVVNAVGENITFLAKADRVGPEEEAGNPQIAKFKNPAGTVPMAPNRVVNGANEAREQHHDHAPHEGSVAPEVIEKDQAAREVEQSVGSGEQARRIFPEADTLHPLGQNLLERGNLGCRVRPAHDWLDYWTLPVGLDGLFIHCIPAGYDFPTLAGTPWFSRAKDFRNYHSNSTHNWKGLFQLRAFGKFLRAAHARRIRCKP